MNKESLLKMMVYSFFVITTGVLAGHYIFCLIFNPDAVFTLGDIGNIFLTATACELPYLIFYSKKELSKQQMLVREIIHLSALLSILLYLANLWNWVDLRNAGEVFVYLLIILAICVVVYALPLYRDKQLADKLNDLLKKRYQ